MFALQNRFRFSIALIVISSLLFSGLRDPRAYSQADANGDIAPQRVIESIERGKRFLLKEQSNDGSWSRTNGIHKIGMTSLVTMTLINCGMTKDDPEIKRALRFLRKVKLRDLKSFSQTYETSLLIMALAVVKDGTNDVVQIGELAISLEKAQVKRGKERGMWGYDETFRSPDRSNTQFALLGLRDAAHAGIRIDRETWQRADDHWKEDQNPDGGWGYNPGRSKSIGSMTVAGISSLSITSTFLRNEKELTPDGRPVCCEPIEPNKSLERGVNWMSKNFSTRANPNTGNWWLYYMYGLERAGRLSGRRFFGENDWYRAGVRTLVSRQSPRTGGWKGINQSESSATLSTAYSLLFLSKGLSPVLINKVKFGPRLPNLPDQVVGDIWNQHPHDARHLAEHISSAEGWPKLVTWQVVDIKKAARNKRLEDLNQSPILYISASENLLDHLGDQEIEMFKEYILQGGFILAVRNCDSEAFDLGFRDLIKKLYPDGSAELKALEPDHPVYRSWHLLDSSTVKLEGVEVGCRTAIIYASEDHSCLWDKWTPYTLPKRSPQMKTMVARSLRVATNIIAYATGGELLNKLDQAKISEENSNAKTVEQGYLKIAKIRHSGDWDAAPNAVRNLLRTLQKSVNPASSNAAIKIPASDPNLFRYAMVYLHGQRKFSLNEQEQKQLRTYLENGGVLFSDACCGASRFDSSFRELMKEIFPDNKLERIPNDHKIFTTESGYDIRKVQRRGPESDLPGTTIRTVVKTVEPYLEGIKIDGRYAVIYSKYDISCALERQTSVACLGYLAKDAVKIAVNVVMHAVLQDSRYAPKKEAKE